ncbi:uncharacterized protein TrAFT101_005103 [Trichoderma asperellum]|uniref:uncharacterized protein n=1 Tax=Trichoderma asperellum TaxID=101201 RepID=UPI003316B90F|nr:hypothetical protein TrAFT101_005103 [Trichoderma asperellum]
MPSTCFASEQSLVYINSSSNSIINLCLIIQSASRDLNLYGLHLPIAARTRKKIVARPSENTKSKYPSLLEPLTADQKLGIRIQVIHTAYQRNVNKNRHQAHMDSVSGIPLPPK